jgi:hypothetical protein
MSKFYVNDIGTEIIVETGSDITLAVVKELQVKKPSGKVVIWESEVYNTTKLRYVVQPGDWDESGTYTIQAYVELPHWSGHGDSVTLKIENLFK